MCTVVYDILYYKYLFGSSQCKPLLYLHLTLCLSRVWLSFVWPIFLKVYHFPFLCKYASSASYFLIYFIHAIWALLNKYKLKSFFLSKYTKGFNLIPVFFIKECCKYILFSWPYATGQMSIICFTFQIKITYIWTKRYACVIVSKKTHELLPKKLQKQLHPGSSSV